MAPLAVDPAAMNGAGKAVVLAGQDLGSVISTLSTALAGSNGMAGDDPAGAAFGRSYDRSASKLLEAMATTRNGICRLGDGVRMSAHNYSLAEANSNISGRGEPLPVPPTTGPVSAGSAPSAVGSGVAAPAGWGWVAPFIGMIWPNGDSAKLRASAAAWIAAGTNFEASEITSAAGPMGTIGAQQIPEAPAIAAAFGDATRSAGGILQQSLSIAAQLTSYAAKIDRVHAAILDLLSRICDPMTGLKEVWEFLTDQDEDEIRKIANDIRVIVNQFTAEVDALRQQIAAAVTEAETILTTMGRYADKEWDQFLHHTAVGRALNQVGQFGKGLGEEAGGLVKDGWTYGLVRAYVDPKGWYHSWEQMAEGMAPLVGLGGEHAPGVGQAWKDLGKNVVHWDEWKTNPAEAAGKSTFDIASLFVPGGGEGAAAAKGAHAAVDAAEAAAKAAPREAALPRALEDAAKPGPHVPEARPPAPPHERPAPPHDEPPPPHEPVGGRPGPAPEPKNAPAPHEPATHSPAEPKVPSTGEPPAADGTKPPTEPALPGDGPPPPPGGSPPPPGQGPPPPGPMPPHPPGDPTPPPAPPPAEPPPMAATPTGDGPTPLSEPPHPAGSPPGEGAPPTGSPHQPAAASPPAEGPPPTAAPHQPSPSTPPAEGHLPPTEEPRPAASVPSGEAGAAAETVPQLATVGSNLAHLPLGEEAATAPAAATNASLSSGARAAELASKAAHEAEPGSAVAPGRPSSLPTIDRPHDPPLTHHPGSRPGSPADSTAARAHGDRPGGHPPGEPPHSGKPSAHPPEQPHDAEPEGLPNSSDQPPSLPTKVPGIDYPFPPVDALEALGKLGGEAARLEAGHVPSKILDGYDPLAGRTPEEFQREFTTTGPNGERRWDWEHQAPNHGFAGVPQEIDHIPAGLHLDRVGPNGGAYMSPEGFPLAERATPPGLAAQYHLFEGTGSAIPPDRNWAVLQGPARSAFGQPGGAPQWVVIDRTTGLEVPIEQLIDEGMIWEISPPHDGPPPSSPQK